MDDRAVPRWTMFAITAAIVVSAFGWLVWHRLSGDRGDRRPSAPRPPDAVAPVAEPAEAPGAAPSSGVTGKGLAGSYQPGTRGPTRTVHLRVVEDGRRDRGVAGAKVDLWDIR